MHASAEQPHPQPYFCIKALNLEVLGKEAVSAMKKILLPIALLALKVHAYRFSDNKLYWMRFCRRLS